MEPKIPHIECRIRFDRKDLCFLSGELIKGQVEVVDTDFDIRNCGVNCLNLVGRYESHLTQDSRHWLLLRRHRNWGHNSVFYYNCFWMDQSDWKDHQDHENRESRVKTAKFRMQLLKQLPSSCIAPFGKVEYVMIFSLLRKHAKYEFEQPITIVRPLNPNEFQLYQKPWQMDLKSIFTCRLRSSCFVPGQTVDFVILLGDNPAVALVHSIEVKLQEIVVYTGCGKYMPRHDLDEIHFHPRTGFFKTAKQAKSQPLQGSLRIPETTVPSSNYPIYRMYLEDMKVYHVIRITVRARFRIMGEGGCEKRITISTRPHINTINHDTAEGSTQKIFYVDQDYFTCLPYDPAAKVISNNIPRAFIPKYLEVITQQDISDNP